MKEIAHIKPLCHHACMYAASPVFSLSGLVCATWACGLWPSSSAPLPWKTDSPSFSIFWLHFSKWSWWRSGWLRKGAVWGEAGPFGDQEQQHRMETVTTKKLVLQKEEQLEWVSQASVSHNCVLLGNIFGKWICKTGKQKEQKLQSLQSYVITLRSGKLIQWLEVLYFLSLLRKGGKSKKKSSKRIILSSSTWITIQGY